MSDNQKKQNWKFILRALKYRNYRLFFSGQGISLIGTWMQQIAMSWLIYRLTNSPFYLGLVSFSAQIPSFILTPIAGVVADRVNRKHILMVTQSFALLQSLILGILNLTGYLTITHILILSLFLGCINAFDMPTRQSFVLDMIDNKEDLSNAIALNSTIFNGARLIGPSIAGIIIAAVGETVCFFINSVSYIAVLAALIAMQITKKAVDKKPTKHILKEFGEGFKYAWNFVPIRSLLMLVALVSLVGMPYTILMPVFARDILHGGSHTLGFLMGAVGVGALTGAYFLASRKNVLGLGRVIIFSVSTFGIGLILFSQSHLFILSILIMLFTGFGMMLQLSSCNTVLQTIVEDDKRGRVMSFYTLSFMGMAPFGNLIAGSISSKYGAPQTLLIGGSLCLIGAILFAIQLPKLKAVVRPIYIKLGLMPETATGIRQPAAYAEKND